MPSPIHQDHAPAAPAVDRTPPLSITEVTPRFPACGVAADENPGGVPCCAGIDLPGMGYTHAQDCVLAEKAERERMGLADFRERLLCELVFAANDLAQSRVVRAVPSTLSGFCFECGGFASPAHIAGHEQICKTGRVLRVLAELSAISSLKSIRKEAAAGKETGRVDDGIRLPGPAAFGEPWRLVLNRELGTIAIYDRNGVLVAARSFADEALILDRFYRIVDCMNSMAGGAR